MARQLVEETGPARIGDATAASCFTEATPGLDPYDYCRRASAQLHVGPVALGGEEQVRVECVLEPSEIRSSLHEALATCPEDARPELLTLQLNDESDSEALEALVRWRDEVMPEAAVIAELPAGADVMNPVYQCADTTTLRFDEASASCGGRVGARVLEVSDTTPPAGWAEKLSAHISPDTKRLVVSSPGLMTAARYVHARTTQAEQTIPIGMRAGLRGERDVMLRAASEMGAMLCDGIGDHVAVLSSDPGSCRSRGHGV